ncbi:uncharacterized protein LOC130720062 isoform X2 [Lotus japonicus]|nr:uncharacterized protein LOC130720062 isoform X2 [Lotus japonicus]
MAAVKIIAICQSGGKFETGQDGCLSYKGGDAHAIDIDNQMNFNDFKAEVAEMFNINLCAMSIKYFLPGNKKTLITISNDKDLQRMAKFHQDSSTVDIYILLEEALAIEVSNMPASRSSRTTLSEAAEPVNTNENHVASDALLDVAHDTNQPDIDMDIPLEVSPTFALSSNDEKYAKGAQQWQNTITGVGQRFSGVHEFRESLRKYAIAHQFAFKYKKNDSHRVTVKCKAEGCPWRIHASRLSTTQLICIKKMNPTHTCEGAFGTTGHQATRSWVASIIKEKLRDCPNYKPKDIVNDIKQEYGIQLNYFQAWRGKEIAKEQLQGSYKDAYSLLPLFCEKLMEFNPGSLAVYTTKEDSSFDRLFVSFHASLYGFQQGCRPLIFLDSIPLRSKYQGALLAATAADADDGVFPVAFAIVDVESDDSWHWFLLQLKSVLSTSCPITFVADIENGLKNSIPEIFEGSFHAYCLRYLTEQLFRDLKEQYSHEVKRLMIEDLYAAAYASKPEGFQNCLESIKRISTEAYDWIIQSEPQYWTNSLFQGTRYNHMTANFGELFYNWAADADELPITQMVDVIMGKLLELIIARKAASDQWETRLSPSMEEKLKRESQKSHPLQVILSTGSTYEVCGDTPTEVVDIDRWECSCKTWQLTGVPCCHAIAVIVGIGQCVYDYCSRYCTTESYRLTYSERVNPIPIMAVPESKDSQPVVTVTPPFTRRPPGRPATKRYVSQNIVKRELHCSRCKGLGHNKSTCKE